MQLVIDASVVFTALTGSGTTKDVIFSKNVELFAPDNLLEEIVEHWLRIKGISGLSEQQLRRLFELIKSRISIAPKSAFDSKLKEEGLPK